MLRRIVALAVVPVVAVLGVGSPARADHNTAHTIFGCSSQSFFKA